MGYKDQGLSVQVKAYYEQKHPEANVNKSSLDYLRPMVEISSNII